MERYEALIAVGDGATRRTVVLPPALAQELGLEADRSVALRFGTRRVQVRWEDDPALADGMRVSGALARSLGLPAGVRLGLWREGKAQVALGPLLGYVTSRAVLRALQAGEALPSFNSMAAAAEEIGALLIFFSAQDIQWDRATVRAGRIQAPAGGPWRLEDGSFPLPRVMLYPTAVTGGPTPRQLAAQVRSVDGIVLSHRKIRKLETFDVLRQVPEVHPYLAYTERLSMDSLTHALRRYDDLYLKPDDLSRGKGVHRLARRRPGGWVLTHRASAGNVDRVLPDMAAVRRAVAPLLRSRSVYLIQEGLPLATFMGNRFDLRALAQRDGTGRWAVSGLATRVAPLGSPITSPRSGGQVALPELVLQHVFGSRGRSVLADVKEATRAIARAMDAALGPLYELGIDLAVLDDGSVRLIEVNGMPLKVSLHRLDDPFANERIDRYPVHYAAWLEIRGTGR